MIVRQAFFRGTITPGREAEFRAFVLGRLKPLWLTFPGLADLRIQFETTRDAVSYTHLTLPTILLV